MVFSDQHAGECRMGPCTGRRAWDGNLEYATKIGGDPRCTGIGLIPYRFYPQISGSGGTGALKSFVPTGSITEECSRANPGGLGLSTESLLYWERPPCIATTVSSPKGQGRIQFRRGTTADPDPVEYLLRLTILIYWQRKNFMEFIEKH